MEAGALRAVSAKLPRLAAWLCLLLLLAVCVGIDELHNWERSKILGEWRTRLEPMVTARTPLADIERIARDRNWPYKLEAGPGSMQQTTAVVFKEDRTLSSLVFFEGFSVYIDLDGRARAGSLTAKSYVIGF